jgi:hypothetical protein
MKRDVWKLSDTVAAVFFGMWFFSMLFFRPFFGGLDILILIVAAIWAASLWTRKQGEEPPVLTKEQEENIEFLKAQEQEWLINPAFNHLPGNIHHKSNREFRFR